MRTAPHPRIAHITTIDGSLRYLLLNQLCYLQQAGFEIIGISSSGPDVPAIETAGVRHLSVSISRALAPRKDLVSLWQLYSIIRRERPVIVHTHTPKPGLLGQLAARLAGVPVVVNTLHGFYFHDHMHPAWRRFYIALEKVAARCSDVILSQNREDIETAIREGICTADKIEYLGNGIDLTRFRSEAFSPADMADCRQQLGISASAPVVGFVGRLAARRKGFLDFLRAGQQVAADFPQTRYLIVGEADVGRPDAVDPSVAQEYGIANQCTFVGHRPNEELPLLYSVMDILVLPSLLEGVPRVVMEASAMGVPAVVTDVKGNREAVEHGRNGLLVPLGDVPALAGAILELLTDRAKARRLGEEGRRLALEHFDERVVFERVKTEYSRLLKQKGLPLPSSTRTC